MKLLFAICTGSVVLQNIKIYVASFMLKLSPNSINWTGEMLVSEKPLQQPLNSYHKLSVSDLLECSDLFYCKQILEVSLNILEAKLHKCINYFK